GGQGDSRGGEIAIARRGAGDLRQRGWVAHIVDDAHGMGGVDVPCDVRRVVAVAVGPAAIHGDRWNVRVPRAAVREARARRLAGLIGKPHALWNAGATFPEGLYSVDRA